MGPHSCTPRAAQFGGSAAMAESFDAATVTTVKKIPLLTDNAGPRDDKEKWEARLKQVGWAGRGPAA